MANRNTRRLLLIASALFLSACAGQQGLHNDGTSAATDAMGASGGPYTEIFTEPLFNASLIDNENQCRLWARNRDGRNTRPCAGEVPTCGAPVKAGHVDLVRVEESGGATAVPAAAEDGANLVTEGFYRVPIIHTVQDTTFALTRRVAREGCDLLVVGEEEWIMLRSPGGAGTPIRYLRVQWGTQDSVAPPAATSAP